MARKTTDVILTLVGILMSNLDVILQITNSKVFWAIRSPLPDALVYTFDVGIQTASFAQFWAVGTFLLDAQVNSLDVGTQIA